MVGDWKFQIWKVGVYGCPIRRNKGADQMHSYCEADGCLCFCICKKPVFLGCGSCYNVPLSWYSTDSCCIFCMLNINVHSTAVAVKEENHSLHITIFCTPCWLIKLTLKVLNSRQLNLQTLQIRMGRLIMSCLIWFCSVCPFVFEFSTKNRKKKLKIFRKFCRHGFVLLLLFFLVLFGWNWSLGFGYIRG